MITRHGKIARLPHGIREELNRRLYNGAMGPELLPWLNEQPAVQEVLRQFFNGAPINRQNLSDWRQHGYHDWLCHQERELRIQRIAEEGNSLESGEYFDLFEHAARIAVAELMAEIDSLHELDHETRWNRLRELTRELARLQNGFNRSRWRALAWTRWNFPDPQDYQQYSQTIAQAETSPVSLPSSPPRPSTPDPLTSSVKVDQGESTGRVEAPPITWTVRSSRWKVNDE